MTSSADPRRTTTRPVGPRRIAGSRRRDVARPTRRRATGVGGGRAEVRATTGASHPDAATTDAAAAADPASIRPRRRLWPAATATLLAIAMLTAVLVFALRPVVSDADRSAAVGSARTTLEALLSYSGSTFEAHVAQVTPRLAAPFRDQFAKVAAADIGPMAVENGATVQAKVYEAGVMDSQGDGGEGTTVRVLAFVNQATTTKKKPTPAIDQNRVVATMRKVGERWLVSDLAAF